VAIGWSAIGISAGALAISAGGLVVSVLGHRRVQRADMDMRGARLSIGNGGIVSGPGGTRVFYNVSNLGPAPARNVEVELDVGGGPPIRAHRRVASIAGLAQDPTHAGPHWEEFSFPAPIERLVYIEGALSLPRETIVRARFTDDFGRRQSEMRPSD
jgi:hypothetical protein